MPRAVIPLLTAAAIAAFSASLAAARTPPDAKTVRLFATSCGWCHEDGGRRGSDKGPRLAGTFRSDAFIIDRIRFGKPGAMPAFGDKLSPGQIRALLHYIRGLNGG